MYLEVTRDSVCAGDDINAPHLVKFRNIEKKSLNDLFEFLNMKYLPRNVQGGTFWLIKNKNNLVGGIELPSHRFFTVHHPEILLSNIFVDREIKAECLGKIEMEKWVNQAALPNYYT